MSAGVLVVGASQAGLQLAVSLRDLGYTEPITLVGEEPHAPYQRPPLSKEFLTGTAGPETLAFRTPAFYRDAGIELVCGEQVTDATLSTGIAGTASGRELPFDRLALTVGAAARRLAVPGADLPGICYLRGLDDATRLRPQLTSASRVVVVGGGFIGLEAAAVARSFGATVTVVEATNRLIGRAVAPVVSEFYRGAHERRGTTVLTQTSVTGFRAAGGRVAGVLLGDGTDLPADLVVVGVGVVPRTELAEKLGLECDGGIVVDARARTSDPAVVAAGDCTVLPHPLTGEGRVRLESVNNAVSQATAAAADAARRARDRPQRAVVLVQPGRPAVADRRPVRRVRLLRRPRRAGDREVLRPLLPGGPTARGGRGEQPVRVHGRAPGTDPGRHGPGRPGGRRRHAPQATPDRARRGLVRGTTTQA